jgi:hypothetical protein
MIPVALAIFLVGVYCLEKPPASSVEAAINAVMAFILVWGANGILGWWAWRVWRHRHDT